MQKKTQLLKLAMPLLILLVVGVTSLSGRLLVAQAVSTSSCQLTWGSGGNTQVDVSQVKDPGLAATVKGYSLNCATSHNTCTLVQGSGDTQLDLSNLPSTSSYLTTNLQGYNLNCNSSSSANFCSNSVFCTSAVASSIRSIIKGSSCQLTWGSGGNTQVDVSQVKDPGLAATVKGYSLNCATSHNTCTLVQGSSDTQLDLSNLPSTSSYLTTNLQGYNLNCGGIFKQHLKQKKFKLKKTISNASSKVSRVRVKGKR